MNGAQQSRGRFADDDEYGKFVNLQAKKIMGKGSFGFVYEAVDNETGERYAIKRTKKDTTNLCFCYIQSSVGYTVYAQTFFDKKDVWDFLKKAKFFGKTLFKVSISF